MKINIFFWKRDAAAAEIETDEGQKVKKADKGDIDELLADAFADGKRRP